MKRMHRSLGRSACFALLVAATAPCLAPLPATGADAGAAAATARALSPQEIEYGRYMIVLGHCNNCHTAEYTRRHGNVPENEWLLGNPVGLRTDAGTTYASNLRLTVQNFTEDQWVAYAKAAKTRPPMPWWSMHATKEQDLRATYRYIRHLGPAGKPAPAFVPPEQEPPKPYERRQIVR